MTNMFWLVVLAMACSAVVFGQKSAPVPGTKKEHPRATHTKQLEKTVLPGAYQLAEYLPKLKGKRVGIFANHTSTIGQTHLVDTLQKLGIKITKIFGPEHGFRGTADAGEKVDNIIDKQTGIPIVSLYGKKRKPSASDLADVDLLLFDIQDVGVRFYTFISSLQEFMESALEHNKPLIVLDRPNPNGFYVDGPVLDTAYRSFVGMQPIPVVYGMTMGEYANFVVGEALLDARVSSGWTNRKGNKSNKGGSAGNNNMDITVIKCRNYTHQTRYVLPVQPSPNLPDAGAVFWYPSTCFFEGTVLSEGRGTDKPFQLFGHPSLPNHLYAFTPTSRDGAKSPKLQNKHCYGWDISSLADAAMQQPAGQMQLKWLLQAYALFPDKDAFFIVPRRDDVRPTDIFFNKLAGNSTLMQQIKQGKTEAEIRASWQPALDRFKAVRKKYLLYPDI